MNKRVFEWIKNHTLSVGGIESWHGSGKVYPEVSGYIIPSLINNNHRKIAEGFADYLVKTQNKDGSWFGLDGKTPHIFDTAAIIEGLECFDGKYQDEIKQARSFLETNVRADGSLPQFPGDHKRFHLPLARAAYILGKPAVMARYIPSSTYPASWGKGARTHYIGYLLEGLFKFGIENSVIEILDVARFAVRQDGFMPFYIEPGWIDGQEIDTCATIQFAILYYKIGRFNLAYRMIQAVENVITSRGGIPQAPPTDKREISWAIKYYLDFYAEAR